MRKDKIYWLYQRQALLEQFQHLDEAARKFHSYNLDYQIANNMTHSGESTDVAHAHLANHIKSPNHRVAAYNHWFLHGGESPVGSYLRKVAQEHYSMGDSVRSPEIDSVPVHKNMVSDACRQLMHAVHSVAHAEHVERFPETLTIYRGVSVHPNDVGSLYQPHPIESWTTDIDTARKFSTMSHIDNAVPHVYRATIHRDHILMSHAARGSLDFIPSEFELVGKHEIVPLGHKLKNIERIE